MRCRAETLAVLSCLLTPARSSDLVPNQAAAVTTCCCPALPGSLLGWLSPRGAFPGRLCLQAPDAAAATCSPRFLRADLKGQLMKTHE